MKTSKILAMILCLALCLSLFAVSAFADTADELKLTLTTDKEEYALGDQVLATLKAENVSGGPVKNIVLKVETPEGLILSGDAQKNVASLEAGASEELIVRFDTKPVDNPVTGDNTRLWTLAVMALICCAVVVLMFVNRKTTCLALALVLLVGVGAPVFAAAQAKTAETEIAVKIDGQKTVLKASAAYEIEDLSDLGSACLKNDTGAESKVSYGNVVATYGADFVYTAKVSLEAYVDTWTRVSSFAFNGSDNSWYNIETDNTGNFTLYGRFNGVEKYWIHLFNKNDEGIMVDGKVQYTVTILKQGQATWLFVNDKLVCSFSEEEMKGYPVLETLEVSAAADRVPGAYDVDIQNARIDNASSAAYAQYAEKTNIACGDAKLANNEGNEAKHGFGQLYGTHSSSVFTATVRVNAYVNDWTRTSAFAFNGSDNSWYNIETDASGNFHLFARFNNVEKYWIYLFNKNDEGIMVDGKVQYTVTILKQGQATWFFVNDKLVCSFCAEEMNGYPVLDSLEVTACANRIPGAFDVDVLNAKVESAVSETYANCAAKTSYSFGNTSLKNDAGDESKMWYGNFSPISNYVYTAKVVVNNYVNDWTRTSAFAFNGSDNSWYNIETDGSGNYTLYARFNGVEKYHIHLFNKNDAGIMVDGKVQYTVAVLKQGQATWFFVNDKLVCSFNAQEMTGYNNLETLEVTACANRVPGAYDVQVQDAKLESCASETYAAYMSKI